MSSANKNRGPVGRDLDYQNEILPGVSRTFALTIPQLPPALRPVVTNAYLVCRIADTVEDEPTLDIARKRLFQQRFRAVLEDEYDAGRFAREISGLLSAATLETEHELVRNTDRVVRVTRSFNARQRNAVVRCISIMCRGMEDFQETASLRGLATVAEMDRYCYFVAGVVGEMLTDLFSDHSPLIERRRDELMRRAVCFGQGLQMTNILKDIWDDRSRDTSWLPRDVFRAEGFDLNTLALDRHDAAFARGLGKLIGIAHGHLREALAYTLLIPRREAGVRRFCSWAIGLAVLTLRNINERRDFTEARQVKVPRPLVKRVILASKLAGRSNTGLEILFDWAARGLPLASLEVCRTEPLPDAEQGYAAIPPSPEPDL